MNRDLRDFAARLSIGLLFVFLSINLFTDFVRTRHVTGLLLLVGEALVVVLTILRRPADRVNRSAVARTAALVSMIGPPLLRAGTAPGLVPDAVTASVSAIGLCLVIAGKLTLGRSFGIVAANRGVVAAGPYLVVRHPIYVGYLITHAAFLVAQPTAMNIALVLCSDTALVVRALIEERTLEDDERYRTYCQRVAWHFVPGGILMRLVNARSDRVMATRMEIAKTRAERRRGLLGRGGLADGSALMITPCFAVHTVGMHFAIDVVFVDRYGRVKKIVRDLGPGRVAGSMAARSVIEFAAGSLLPDGVIAVGDRLYVELGKAEAPPAVGWEAVPLAS